MDLFNGNLYPTQEVFKYPKAGEDNSTVNIYLYDLTNKENAIYTEEDYEYIPRIKWANDPNTLTMIGLNRHQNKLDFIVVNSQDGSNSVFLVKLINIILT